MAFRARTVEQSRSVSYVCNFRGVVDLRDLPYAPVEQWCVGSSMSHVDRSHKMQWGVSFSLSSFSFMFSYIDRLAATRNQLLHALRGNSLFKVLAHNVNGISSVGKFPAICSLDADVLALTETQATTNNQRASYSWQQNKDWNIVWGHAQPSSSRTGVAIMVIGQKLLGLLGPLFLTRLSVTGG